MRATFLSRFVSVRRKYASRTPISQNALHVAAVLFRQNFIDKKQ